MRTPVPQTAYTGVTVAAITAPTGFAVMAINPARARPDFSQTGGPLGKQEALSSKE